MNSNKRNFIVALCFLLSFLVLVVLLLQLLDVPILFSKFYRTEDASNVSFVHLNTKTTQTVNSQILIPHVQKSKYPKIKYSKNYGERPNLNSPLVYEMSAPSPISQNNMVCLDEQLSPFDNPRLQKRSNGRMEMDLSVNQYAVYKLDFNTLRKRFTRYKSPDLYNSILNGKLNAVSNGPYNLAVFPPDPSVPVGDGLLCLFVLTILHAFFKFRNQLFLVFLSIPLLNLQASQTDTGLNSELQVRYNKTSTINQVHSGLNSESAGFVITQAAYNLPSLANSSSWYSDVTVTEISSTSAKIQLNATDNDCMGYDLRVNWGKNQVDENITSMGTVFCTPQTYSITLNGLESNTEYRFLFNDDFSYYGNSIEYTFRTKKADLNVNSERLVNDAFEVNNLTISGNAKMNIDVDGCMIDGDLKLVYNSVSTAQLLSDYNLNVSGSTVLEKTIVGGKWYFLSIPFDFIADSLKKVINNVESLASWGDPVGSGFQTGKDIYIAEYDGYSRDQSSSSSTAGSGVFWKNVNPHSLLANKGYIVAIESDSPADSVTFRFKSARGHNVVLNQQISVPVSRFNTSSLLQNRNWNLLGNPYLYSVDLRQTLNHKPYYLFDGSSYQVVMGDISDDESESVLKPFASFFCQATSEDENLIFNNQSSFTASNAIPSTEFYNPQIVKMELWDESEKCDYFRIRLGENYLPDFIPGEDALKIESLSGSKAQIATQSDMIKYAVNSIPENQKNINIYTKFFENGNYKLKWVMPELASQIQNLYILDRLSKVIYNLRENPEISFEASQDDSNRFEMVFDQVMGADDNCQTNQITIQHSRQDIIISGLPLASCIAVYNLLGEVLYQDFNSESEFFFHLKKSGFYLIQVKYEDRILLTKKITI